MLRILTLRRNRSTLADAQQKMHFSYALMNGYEKSPIIARQAYVACLEAISIANNIPADQANEESTGFLLMAHLHALRLAVYLNNWGSTPDHMQQHAIYLEQNITAQMIFSDPVHAVQSACALFYLGQMESDAKNSEIFLFRGRRALHYHYSPKNIAYKAKHLTTQQNMQLVFCLSELLKALRLKNRLNESELIAGMLMSIIAPQLRTGWCDILEYFPNMQFESQELTALQTQLIKSTVLIAFDDANYLLSLEPIDRKHAEQALICCDHARSLIRALPVQEQENCEALRTQCHDLIAEILKKRNAEYTCMPSLLFIPVEQRMLINTLSNLMCSMRPEIGGEMPRVCLLEDLEDEDQDNRTSMAVVALHRNRAIGGVVRVERDESSSEENQERKAAGDIIRKKHRQ